jgi:hypothetical protein
MPRLRFTQDFDFKVNPHVVRAYKAGKEYLVSQAAAEQALSKGRAVPLDRPNRKSRKASDVSG